MKYETERKIVIKKTKIKKIDKKLFILINFIFGQTYSVGDYVDNFSAEICYNGEGTWEWEVDGINKVTWISSFATW